MSFCCYHKLVSVIQSRMSRCLALVVVLTWCGAGTGGGIRRCCGCHQKQKWNHCDCRKTRRILNLVPDMSEKLRFMTTPLVGYYHHSGNTKAFDRCEAHFFIHDCCFQECAHLCKVHGDTMEQHTHILVIPSRALS